MSDPLAEMYDFHTHTFLSDGVFTPAESVRRAQVTGYRMLGIADHSDLATLPTQMPQTLRAAEAENRSGSGLTVFPGTELTHVRPNQLEEAVRLARDLGAWHVVVHGETLMEPVEPGTNRAAILAGADILAHPGLISKDDARLAAERGVKLELSGKRGHNVANGHVVRMARETGATLIFNSDAHTVGDMPTRMFAEKIALAAGLDQHEVDALFATGKEFGMALLRRFAGGK